MTLRRATLRLALAALAAAGGCHPPGAVAGEEDGLHAAVRAGAIELDNHSTRTVFYRVAERDLASRLRWVPCVDEEVCDAFGPHASVQIRLDEVPGYSPAAREAVVFWWFARENADGGAVADSVRSVVVRF